MNEETDTHKIVTIPFPLSRNVPEMIEYCTLGKSITNLLKLDFMKIMKYRSVEKKYVSILG